MSGMNDGWQMQSRELLPLPDGLCLCSTSTPIDLCPNDKGPLYCKAKEEPDLSSGGEVDIRGPPPMATVERA